jgi:hypothetical protein
MGGIFDKSVSDLLSFSGKTRSPNCQNSRSRNSQIYIVCGETVTQQHYPGHKPLYCSEGCKEDRQREKTRERVAKHRKEKKAEVGNSTSREHVTS